MKRRTVALSLLGITIAALAVAAHRPLSVYSVRVVLSGSMGRAAPKGSLLLVRRLAGKDYALGDVVVAPVPFSGSDTVAHRVIGTTRTRNGIWLQTKGDANPNGDGWQLPADQAEGKVLLVVPWLGYVPLVLHTLPGYLLFALGTFVLFVWPLSVGAHRAYRSGGAEGSS